MFLLSPFFNKKKYDTSHYFSTKEYDIIFQQKGRGGFWVMVFNLLDKLSSLAISSAFNNLNEIHQNLNILFLDIL